MSTIIIILLIELCKRYNITLLEEIYSQYSFYPFRMPLRCCSKRQVDAHSKRNYETGSFCAITHRMMLPRANTF